ncbi:histone deacetylase superfamily [Emticicia oligotrophica DSM 17448]|uniref:Histone deacetylase superfamily n=1 Tax=Emticicia oligotrophica (strain DSM 17448 / CIP 109782 / MTCC 6937 / GPTSA100-15) TaxID=929562 RepID=A0ABM5N4E2_EMTOG|nr:histone deacetylase [Emticicia oligotrophica]AFK04372.1 histone deacetylase superfamily [Emticicia oligotrophica DSM 17448]
MLKIAYNPIYRHPLPEGHRFPMMKYELIPEQLLYEGTCTEENFFSPTVVDKRWVLGVHNEQYFNDLLNLSIDPKMERRIGFPISEMLVKRELIITQGTIDCCHYALQYGISMNIAGGTHHAYSDKGEGFCLLNDVAVAANYLLENQIVKKVLVIDLDVHQGNGTAEIFQQEPRVFTFSMHGKENYPLKKEISDLDIELPTYCKDEDYLNILYDTLPRLIEVEKPEFLFYISGVDILASDKLGKLSVSMEGCRRRDEFVFEQAIKHKLPIVVSMGGGYSPRIADIVEAHCNTYRLAERMYF